MVINVPKEFEIENGITGRSGTNRDLMILVMRKCGDDDKVREVLNIFEMWFVILYYYDIF
jgi:hypothetical protein